jgi:hypothetical protein
LGKNLAFKVKMVLAQSSSVVVTFDASSVRIDIAHPRNGQDLTPEELGEWYIKLQDVGRVHNINLITPEVRFYLV